MTPLNTSSASNISSTYNINSSFSECFVDPIKPFGLKMGWTDDDLKKNGSLFRDNDVVAGTFSIIPPVPNPNFDLFLVNVDPNYGLTSIVATATEGLSEAEYTELKTILFDTYGKPRSESEYSCWWDPNSETGNLTINFVPGGWTDESKSCTVAIFSEHEMNKPDSIKSYSGFGDDVISIDTPSYPCYMHIEGNFEEDYFGVRGYDIRGNSTELFVNETVAYSGNVIDPSQRTKFLEIKATGYWQIDIISLGYAQKIREGERLYGYGDDVIYIMSPVPTVVDFWSMCDGNIIIWAYDINGLPTLLVNDVDLYSGTIRLPDGTSYLTIHIGGKRGLWGIGDFSD